MPPFRPILPLFPPAFSASRSVYILATLEILVRPINELHLSVNGCSSICWLLGPYRKSSFRLLDKKDDVSCHFIRIYVYIYMYPASSSYISGPPRNSPLLTPSTPLHPYPNIPLPPGYPPFISTPKPTPEPSLLNTCILHKQHPPFHLPHTAQPLPPHRIQNAISGLLLGLFGPVYVLAAINRRQSESESWRRDGACACCGRVSERLL